MPTQSCCPSRWRYHAVAILSLLAAPLTAESDPALSPFQSSVGELRLAVGLWNVTTTQYGEDGTVSGIASGTYRFDWIVPDRVLAGRSDIPDWKQSSGILLFVNERRQTIEMASVGADGHLWIMTGPAGGETRATPPTPLADGRKMQLRFTRSAVTPDRFESRVEISMDGGASWKQGNHQVFVRAQQGAQDSDPRLRFRSS